MQSLSHIFFEGDSPQRLLHGVNAINMATTFERHYMMAVYRSLLLYEEVDNSPRPPKLLALSPERSMNINIDASG